MNLDEASLLELLKKLPVQEKREWSFLETIKVAQRETIMANLLAYYFKPQEEHGLGDLFIQSLLSCYFADSAKPGSQFVFPEPEKLNLGAAGVQTEVITTDNKRIDILISSRQFVMAIEFKINHVLDNPLDEYVDYVQKEFPEVPEGNRWYIILTPTRQQPQGQATTGKAGLFRQIMLSHFIGRVAETVKEGNWLADKTSPQYHYFHDLIKTINNRRREIDMLENYQKILAENPDFSKNLEGFYADLQTISKMVEEKLAGLQKVLNGYSLLKSSENKLYSVIEKKRGEAAVKVRLSLEGWKLEHWIGREKKDDWVELDFNTPREEVKEAVLIFEQGVPGING